MDASQENDDDEYQLVQWDPVYKRYQEWVLAGCRQPELLSQSDRKLLARVRELPYAFFCATSQDGDPRFKQVKKVDLSVFPNLTSVPDKFCFGCILLESICLKPLFRINEIPNHFLSSCESLKEVSFEHLQNVSRIGSSFMRNCRNLERLDLSPLSQSLQKIEGDNFLSWNINLKELNLSALKNCEQITGDFFLNQAWGRIKKVRGLARIDPAAIVSTSKLDACANNLRVAIQEAIAKEKLCFAVCGKKSR